MEGDFTLEEFKVYYPPEVNGDFIAAGFKHKRSIYPIGSTFTTVKLNAAGRYALGRSSVAVYLYASEPLPDVAGSAAPSVERSAIKRLMGTVTKMAVHLDAKWKPDESSVRFPGRDSLDVSGLPRVDVRSVSPVRR